jgi:hypothetical protein
MESVGHHCMIVLADLYLHAKSNILLELRRSRKSEVLWVVHLQIVLEFELPYVVTIGSRIPEHSTGF